MNQHSKATIEYYERNAAEYVAQTIAVDMQPLYDKFLKHIPNGGRILDAGCGSGRDSLAFKQRGYRVTAFDASAGMVEHARKLTGLDVKELRFEDFDMGPQFDGIWACASLLHVQRDQLADAVGRLGKSLLPGGVIYASFKHGETERVEGGRYFNDVSLQSFDWATVLSMKPILLTVGENWLSDDIRENDTKWANVLFHKAEPGKQGESRSTKHDSKAVE